MKKYFILSIIPILALGLLAGCAGKKGPSDEELVMQQTQALVADVLAVKTDNILNYISEDFTHDEVSGKQEIAEHLQKAKDDGKIEELPDLIKDHDGKIDMTQAKVTVDKAKGTASVYPIDASADIGAVTVEIIFKKDPDKVWRILTLNIEGI